MEASEEAAALEAMAAVAAIHAAMATEWDVAVGAWAATILG